MVRSSRKWIVALIVPLIFYSVSSQDRNISGHMKMFHLLDAKFLSQTYLKSNPSQSVAKLLSRAKKAGYNYVKAKMVPQVLCAGTDFGGQDNHVFYPKAIAADGSAVHYYEEAFVTAYDSGFILIPEIPMFSGRCNKAACGPDPAWDDLHPAAVDGRKCDFNGLAANITLNHLLCTDYADSLHGSTPLADDGQEGFIEHLHELYSALKSEYDAARKKRRKMPAALPYIYEEWDESYAPVNVAGFSGCVLLLGQSNSADQNFLSTVIAKNKAAIGEAKAVKLAISSLFAFRMAEEVKAIKATFGPSTKLIIGGFHFDPQTGGGYDFITCCHPQGGYQSIFSPVPCASLGSNYHIKLAENTGDGYDALDLPGLPAMEKTSVQKNVIIAPWFFDLVLPGTTAPYSWAATFDYLKTKKFSFIPWSALWTPGCETVPKPSSVEAMRQCLSTVFAQRYSGYAKGFIAGWWPYFYCHSRNGHTDYGNDSWHDDLGMNTDQPFEYDVLEYMIWMAKGRAGIPKTGSR